MNFHKFQEFTNNTKINRFRKFPGLQFIANDESPSQRETVGLAKGCPNKCVATRLRY